MENLKRLKKLYDKLGNDYLRSTALTTAGALGIRKDVIRLDTNCCCNAKCIMCDSKPKVDSNPFMDFQDFKKLLDFLAPTTRILYLSCAYEPLITPNFSDYLTYAKRKGIPHISFCTNGILLNEELTESLIVNEIDEIILSFNGFSKDDYNRIMKGSDYDKVYANIKRLADIKRQYRIMRPKIRMNTVLLKSNLAHFDEMLQLVEECDIDLIQFRELMLYENQNNPSEVKNELLENQSLSEYQKMARNIQDMTKRLHENGKKIILPGSILQPPAVAAMEAAEEIHPLPDTDGAWNIEKRSNVQKHRCSIPFFSYWVDHDCNINICGYDDNGRIGNIKRDSTQVLKKRRREFQRKALSGNCQHEKCTINVDTSTIV